MKKELSPLELMDKFLNSDPAYIKSMLEEFEDLNGEGPSVLEYFEKYDTAFNYFNRYVEEISEYECAQTLEMDSNLLYPNSNTLSWLNVQTSKKEINFSIDDNNSQVYPLAA